MIFNKKLIFIRPRVGRNRNTGEAAAYGRIILLLKKNLTLMDLCIIIVLMKISSSMMKIG